MKRIFLIGPRGSGKTTIAQSVAQRLGCPLQDTDEALQQSIGETIAEFVGREGWAAFRAKETEILRQIIEKTGPASGKHGWVVISTGGGIILSQENRDLLKTNGVTFYLQVPVPVLAERLQNSPLASQRPSLTGKDLIQEIEEVSKFREPLYLEAADIILNAGSAVLDVCENLLKDLGPLQKAKNLT